MAKIKEVNENHILFDDGCTITFDHWQDCLENNYADFVQLEESALNYDFDTNNMKFESVNNVGFRFGNNYMFFIPCYSEQNGYYTTELDIYLNDMKVLHTECKLELD